MAENRAEVLAGAAVLAVAIGFGLYATKGAGLSVGAASYPLKASFRSVEGISVGSDVRLAGVKVGTITGLTLNPTTYFADAEIAMQDGILLPDDSAILISQEGLLGGNYIEIMPGGSPDNLGPGDEIEDTQGSVSLINLLLKWVGGQGGDTPEDSPEDGAPAP